MIDKIKCGECGSTNVSTSMQNYEFNYGVKEQRVKLSCLIPARTCGNCGFRFMDCEAEDIIDETVQKHLRSKQTKDDTNA